jgi:hypothetical protein
MDGGRRGEAQVRSDLQALVGDTPGVEWFVVAAGTLMRT